MPKMYGSAKKECGKDSGVVYGESSSRVGRYDTKAFGGREEVEHFALMMPDVTKQIIHFALSCIPNCETTNNDLAPM